MYLTGEYNIGRIYNMALKFHGPGFILVVNTVQTSKTLFPKPIVYSGASPRSQVIMPAAHMITDYNDTVPEVKILIPDK